jgi:ATP-dependent protease ClpP protease subunit
MDPDELATAQTLTFDPIRRDALDKLSTFFLGPITADEAERLNKTLYIFAAQRRQQFQETGQVDASPFVIYLNSPGGDVDAGLSVMNMCFRVQREYGYPIHMIVLGMAYSMAVILLQSATRRFMEPFATALVHAPSWTLAGKEDVIFRDYEKLADGYRHNLAVFFAQRTGKHDADWWEAFLYSREERFLFPDECLELGLIDEILAPYVIGRTNLTAPAGRSQPDGQPAAKH